MKAPYVALKTQLPWASGHAGLAHPHLLEDIGPLYLLHPCRTSPGANLAKTTLALAVPALTSAVKSHNGPS